MRHPAPLLPAHTILGTFAPLHTLKEGGMGGHAPRGLEQEAAAQGGGGRIEAFIGALPVCSLELLEPWLLTPGHRVIGP